ncbi:NAD(P)H-hydrate dehydratase, partial [Vibrio cholerae]|uniref:NAD(P)H-hydrate dehydratase n=1 Tax=Vibrio cholerae TaxID=666 RepID=UPI000AD199DA
GKALIVGGNEGMGGALILCASACARSGAGLSAAMTHPDNVTAMLTITPEVMSTSGSTQNQGSAHTLIASNDQSFA